MLPPRSESVCSVMSNLIFQGGGCMCVNGVLSLHVRRCMEYDGKHEMKWHQQHRRVWHSTAHMHGMIPHDIGMAHLVHIVWGAEVGTLCVVRQGIALKPEGSCKLLHTLSLPGENSLILAETATRLANASVRPLTSCSVQWDLIMYSVCLGHNGVSMVRNLRLAKNVSYAEVICPRLFLSKGFSFIPCQLRDAVLLSS